MGFARARDCGSWRLTSSSKRPTALRNQSTNMTATRSRAGLLKVLQRPIVSLPDFLVPAIASSLSQPFSTSSRCASRVGSAPLSLPAEVNLRLLELPTRRKRTVTRVEPPRVLEIAGPLGKLAFIRCDKLLIIPQAKCPFSYRHI